MTNRKLHARFRLVPISKFVRITLNSVAEKNLQIGVGRKDVDADVEVAGISAIMRCILE